MEVLLHLCNYDNSNTQPMTGFGHDDFSEILEYKCGACYQVFQTICHLHEHLFTHKLGGSYHYDHTFKTAFPQYDYKCSSTQTDALHKWRCEKKYKVDSVSCNVEATEQRHGAWEQEYCNIKAIDENQFSPSEIKQEEEYGLQNSQSEISDLCRISEYSRNQKNKVTKNMRKQSSATIQSNHQDESTSLDALYKASDSQTAQGCDKNALEKIRYSIDADIEDIGKLVEDTFSNDKTASHETIIACISCDIDTPKKDSFDFSSSTVNSRNGDMCEQSILYKTNSNLINGKQHDLQECQGLPESLKVSIKCENCHNTFSSRQALEEHLPSCGINNTDSQHSKHIQNRNTQKDGGQIEKHKHWVCQPCGKVYSSQSGFYLHKVSKHSKKLYTCDICENGCQFSSKYSLRQHKIQQHFTEITDHYCKTCKKQFMYKHLYEQHMVSIHKDMSYAKENLICEYCGYQTSEKAKFRAHKSVCQREKTVECQQCEYITYTKRGLRAHMQSHGLAKNIMCQYCGFITLSMSSLNRHLRIHTGERPFKCKICGKAFRTETPFYRHMAIHDRKLAYKCDYCKKEFIQKNNCVAHMRQHTGVKPYQCEFCGKGFAHNVSRKSHSAKCLSKKQNDES